MTIEADVYRRALYATGVVIIVIAVVGAVVGYTIDGVTGLVGAGTGVGVAAVSGLTTQAAMLVGHRKSSNAMASIVLGSWALKMLLIIVALLVLQGIDGFHRPLFATAALTGVVLTLVIDVWVLHRSRVPYVDSRSNHLER
ncbi:MAG: hypothetical protein WDZ57_02610 [Demequina sp.]